MASTAHQFVTDPESLESEYASDRQSGSLEAGAATESLSVDLNEASVNELRSLPGIGEVLANRIIAYRQEHGRFEQATDLTRVAGITEKRLSKFAPRLSVSPANSDFRQPVASASPGPSISSATNESSEGYTTTRLFSISSDVLRGQLPPSMASLLPRGPEEPSWFDETPITLAPERAIAASLAPPQSKRQLAIVVDDASDDDFVPIPLQRPWKVWLVLGTIGFFSATVGAIFGMRSQDGGPRALLERRMGRVQDDVTDLQSSVRDLSGENTTIVNSINSLDERLAQQEHLTVARPSWDSRAAAIEGEGPAAKTRPTPSQGALTRGNVRKSFEGLDSLLPSRR